MDIFSLISTSYIVSVNDLTLQIIGQCDVKHIMTLSITKSNVICFKISTCIITSISVVILYLFL